MNSVPATKGTLNEWFGDADLATSFAHLAGRQDGQKLKGVLTRSITEGTFYSNLVATFFYYLDFSHITLLL
jgi:hypothetical protein